MKLLGLVCIVLAGALAGLAASGRLRREAGQCERLIGLVGEMESSIRYRGTPVQELLQSLAGTDFSFPGRISARMAPDMPLPVLWREAVAADAQVPACTRQVLCTLGETLGTTDTAGALAALALCREGLSQAARESRERYARQGRMFRALGLLGGAMAALLLL
ncbi:MAG: stage III sporulation protein AB [Oscillospiraceae bacterium]|nr:stage III sporulation protein AB [Oscillospiraceae bacterium]